MPKRGNGTECIKILLSQVSKDMQEPLFPMFFPILGAHVSGSEMQYPDLIWKELCGQMTSLVADSGCNRGQLSNIVEAICRGGTTKRARLSCNLAHITCHSSPYSEPTSPIFSRSLFRVPRALLVGEVRVVFVINIELKNWNDLCKSVWICERIKTFLCETKT